VDKRVETAKSQSLICPPTNLFLSSLDDRNIIAQTGMVYHLCANQDLLKINDSFKKIVILKDCYVPWYDENGIYYIGLEQFLLDPNLLEK
ncbi:MAG: hypothetical protein PUJ85_05185, partial [bacterium]|nr:hypothetical protein [bacterium]